MGARRGGSSGLPDPGPPGGAALARLLRYLALEITKDSKTVIEEYPFVAVKDMYAEVTESLQTAARYYSRGNLLMAGRWVKEALQFTDIEIKAHTIFMSHSALSYVGRRVGLAAIGFVEGAADAVLGLVDEGAGLVGYDTGLVEWNTARYNQIKEGYSDISGIEHTAVRDAEIGRFGGKVAGGLALGKGLSM